MPCRSYGRALASLAGWLAENHPVRRPGDVTRADIRGWLAWVTRTRSASTARTWLAGVRRFFRFAAAEDEISTDPTIGVRGPAPAEPVTEVLAADELKALLAACGGKSFTARRDTAIIFTATTSARSGWGPAAGTESAAGGLVVCVVAAMA